MKIRRNIFIIISTFIFLLFVVAVYLIAPWYGKVVDKNTGQPIEGAVVVRSWDVETASPAGTVTSFLGMKETLTNKNGKFIVFKKLYFPGIPILIWVSENRPIIFKPGYKFLILDNKTSTISLERIPTIIEIRKKELWDARGNYEVDLYKTNIFLKIIEKEREFTQISEPFRPDFQRITPYDPPFVCESYISRPPASVTPLLSSSSRNSNSQYLRNAKKGIKDIPMQNEKTIMSLVDTLKEKDLTIKCRSFAALIKIGKEAVEPLINALSNKDSRVFAALALGEIQDQRAIGPLIRLLNLNERGISHVAAKVLGNFKDKKAIKALVKALKHKDLRYQVRKALIDIGPLSVEYLVPELQNKDRSIRLEVIKALGKIKDLSAVKALIKAWDDEDFDVRVKAAESLVEIGTPAVEPLISLLQDEDSYLRWRAAWCLGMIKAPISVKPLNAALQDKAIEVQWIAIDALGRIGDKKSVKHLVAFCKNKDAGLREKAESTIMKLSGQNICKNIKQK